MVYDLFCGSVLPTPWYCYQSIKKTMSIDHNMHLLNEKNTHLVATDAIPVYRYVIQLK